MSSRITINVGFYFEKQHYAQMQGYIPRAQAINIPQLRIEERQRQGFNQKYTEDKKNGKQPFSESKKESDDQMFDQDQNNQGIQMDAENDQDNQPEDEQDRQQDVQRALQQLQEDNFDSDDQDSQEQQQLDLSSLSGQPNMKGYPKQKTKRQKGETKDLVELPDRRPRKDKKMDEASELIRKQEKERKRKQYLKKQTQAHEKATLQKILNETGRKLRLREQKQMKQEMQRQQKTYRTLGNAPKIITINNENGKLIMIHNTTLFPEEMTQSRDIKMKEPCSNCGKISKYKLPKSSKLACSLPCYKMINAI